VDVRISAWDGNSAEEERKTFASTLGRPDTFLLGTAKSGSLRKWKEGAEGAHRAHWDV
jgi:hypothetical protein